MPVNRYSTYMKKTTLFIWLAFMLAAAAVAAAHEIYGHAYYKMTHPIDTLDMQKEEPLAYGRSVAFVENLLASHLAEKLSPAQKKAFEEALAREKTLQSRYK